MERAREEATEALHVRKKGRHSSAILGQLLWLLRVAADDSGSILVHAPRVRRRNYAVSFLFLFPFFDGLSLTTADLNGRRCPVWSLPSARPMVRGRGPAPLGRRVGQERNP